MKTNKLIEMLENFNLTRFNTEHQCFELILPYKYMRLQHYVDHEFIDEKGFLNLVFDNDTISFEFNVNSQKDLETIILVQSRRDEQERQLYWTPKKRVIVTPKEINEFICYALDSFFAFNFSITCSNKDLNA